MDFCSRGFLVVEGFPLPGVWSLLPSHVGLCGATAGAPPTSPNQPTSLASLPASGSAETAPLLFCLQLECEGQGAAAAAFQPFSPSEGLQLLPCPLGLPGPHRSSPIEAPPGQIGPAA